MERLFYFKNEDVIWKLEIVIAIVSDYKSY